MVCTYAGPHGAKRMQIIQPDRETAATRPTAANIAAVITSANLDRDAHITVRGVFMFRHVLAASYVDEPMATARDCTDVFTRSI